jgi:hypothetical protein
MICSSLNLEYLIVRLLQDDRTLLIFGGSSGAQVNTGIRPMTCSHTSFRVPVSVFFILVAFHGTIAPKAVITAKPMTPLGAQP